MQPGLLRVLGHVQGEDMSYAELRQAGNSLMLLSDYSPALVAALKAKVPFAARRWEPDTKAWLIDPTYGAAVQRIVQQHLGVDVHVPQVQNQNALTTRLLRVEYIGQTKDRQDSDERTAFGYVDGQWAVIFPEGALKKWFDVESVPTEKPTLYGMLGVARTANVAEIKTAYRRAARQWHPDVNRDPDAPEQFMAIQRAYDVLGNELARRKYDAGLQLEASLRQQSGMSRLDDVLAVGYRAPLTCGYILAVGTESLGRFVVREIKQWEDIVDAAGRVMVTSWPKGADLFVTNWV